MMRIDKARLLVALVFVTAGTAVACSRDSRERAARALPTAAVSMERAAPRSVSGVERDSVVSASPDTAGAVSGAASVRQSKSATCLRYEPDSANLDGIVSVQTRYGPPNFGETPEKDEKLRVTFLTLQTPTDVCAGGSDEDDREPLRGVRQVQLNLAKLQPRPTLRSGEAVSVRGTLYHGFSGYHFTPAVMNVAQLHEREPSR